MALSYIPPTIAGFILLYRGRYVAGAALLSLFAMMQLNANHPQMSYYFVLVMAILAICYLIEAIRRHTVRRWAIASAVALVAGGLALGANAPSLYNTYKYAKETKRAQSELTPLEQASGNNSTAERPTGGLPKKRYCGLELRPVGAFYPRGAQCKRWRFGSSGRRTNGGAQPR